MQLGVIDYKGRREWIATELFARWVNYGDDFASYAKRALEATDIFIAALDKEQS